jgi:hypothetical protein
VRAKVEGDAGRIRFFKHHFGGWCHVVSLKALRVHWQRFLSAGMGCTATKTGVSV